jgi:pimeloyl-ACP methyl ester carboxylesterase
MNPAFYDRRSFILASGLAVTSSSVRATAGTEPESPEASKEVSYRAVEVDDLSIFYREAGSRSAPTLLLLHGFPSSSFMFRHLIPELAQHYHVVAPDYPGFGFSTAPHPEAFRYTFAHLTDVVRKFTDRLGLNRYALYIQDYGAPVGLRLALQRPRQVTGLIVQNGNAYEEGLSGEWAMLREYWQRPTSENHEKIRSWLNPESIRQQYVAGVPGSEHHRFSPETWTLDWTLLQRPGIIDAQLDLFGDYQNNVALYGDFQALFRKYRFPTLIAWGERDVYFTKDGARAYLRDLPDAKLHFFDAGHFALETHCAQIGALIREFQPSLAASGSSRRSRPAHERPLHASKQWDQGSSSST